MTVTWNPDFPRERMALRLFLQSPSVTMQFTATLHVTMKAVLNAALTSFTSTTDLRRPVAFLTLDVEDWEHANFAQLKGREAMIAETVRARSYRMDANTDRFLSICEEFSAKSTCFVLGEYARRYPASVRRIVDSGHEVACHGDTHDLVYEMSRERFRDYLRRALGEVGAITGRSPLGFRAPSWSVNESRTPWFCQELEVAGLSYDSSEFPVKTPLFGQPGARLRPYRAGTLLRVPVSVLTIAGARLPFSSGAFFRLMPRSIIRFGLLRAARQSRPAMVVLHPRELDPDHPRLPLSGWEARIHYVNLSTTIAKLRYLMPFFQWKSIQSELPRIALEADNP